MAGVARMGLRAAVLLLAASLGGTQQARAGAAGQGGPILFFDSFEKANKYWNGGKNGNEKSARPQGSSRKLDVAPWDKDKKTVWAQFRAGESGLKLTGALAEQLFVGFQLFCDDAKEIQIGLNDGYGFSQPEPKGGNWVPVSCCLRQCLNKGKKHPPPELQIREISIVVVSKSGKTPVAYIDDFIVTGGATPEACWPAALAAEGERQKRVTDPASTGFTFNDDMETALEEALHKAASRPEAGSVLAITFGKSAGAFSDAVKEANPRRRLAAFQGPEGLKLGSVNDLRLFLPCAMSKSGGEMVLLMPPPKAMMWANPADAALITKRCLAAGSIPVWILPTLPNGAKEDDVKKLNGANAAVGKEVNKLGAPTVDARFALKDVAQAWDGGDLNAAGCQAVAKVASAAMAHVDRFVRGR